MADTTFTLVQRSLQEVESDTESEKLRQAKTLQNIPLAEGGSEVTKDEEFSLQQQENSNNDRKLKTSSLKRFFRMPSKKMGTSDDVEPKKSGQVVSEGDTTSEFKQQNPTPSVKGEDCVHDFEIEPDLKRFKLRFGGMQQSTSNIDLTASSSRLTLKSSMSSYWNSMFKQKKSKKSTKSNNDFQQDEQLAKSINLLDNSTDANPNFKKSQESEKSSSSKVNSSLIDNILAEEIHTLKISEESTLK